MAPDPAAIRYTRAMKAIFRLVFCLTLLACALAAPIFAQEGPLDPAPPKDTTPEEIIKRFAAKETEFAKARDQYTYRQDVKVQTKDGDTVDGEYHEVFDVLFDNKGKRLENVVFAPQSNLTKIYMSQEDLEDIRHRLPFVLTTKKFRNTTFFTLASKRKMNCTATCSTLRRKKSRARNDIFRDAFGSTTTIFRL